jgi:hypothetical protein
MGVETAIATGLGSALQFGQGMSAKNAGQQAAATGERQLAENEAFAGSLGQTAMGALDTALGGLGNIAQNGIDFGNVANTQQMAMENALGFGERARATAQEQMALGFNQQSDALDAALASRGLSRNSGVAAGALGGLLGQQGQQMSEFNRGLADQQGNMALQAGQFDAQNALGLGQLNLGGLNAQLGALGSIGQLGMGGIGNVLANQQANLGLTSNAVSSAGAGKGAGIGGLGGNLFDLAETLFKQQTTASAK